jgi:MFS family permease
MLFRVTPPHIRSAVFSIKQSAVPIGQMVAGLAIPAMLLVTGWQALVCGIALMIAAYGVAMAVVPSMRIDAAPAQRGAAAEASAGSLLAPLRTVWITPALRELALTGIAYTANQLCMLAFLVSYLNLEIGLSLILAGTLFSLAQAGAMIGRLSWGIVADRWMTPRIQVGMLGMVGGVCGLLAALFSPSWPYAAIAVISVLYGATAVGWNGVYFAEAARLSPANEVGKTMGGLQFYTAIGASGGPLLFSALVSWSGTYAAGFALFSLPSLLFGARLAMRREVAARDGGSNAS